MEKFSPRILSAAARVPSAGVFRREALLLPVCSSQRTKKSDFFLSAERPLRGVCGLAEGRLFGCARWGAGSLFSLNPRALSALSGRSVFASSTGVLRGFVAAASAKPSPEDSVTKGKAAAKTGGGAELFAFLELLRKFFSGEQLPLLVGLAVALLASSAAQLFLPVCVGRLLDDFSLSSKAAPPVEAVAGRGAVTNAENEEIEDEAEEVQPAAAERGCGLEAADKARRDWRVSLWMDAIQGLNDRLAFCALLAALGTAATFVRLYLLELLIERLATRLRLEVFAKLLAQPTWGAAPQSSAAAGVRLLSQETAALSRLLVELSFSARCFITAVVGGGLCVCTAPPLFLLSLAAPVGLSLALLRVSSRAARKTQMESSAALTAVLDATLTALSRRGDLRALNGEKRELKNFKLRLQALLLPSRRNAVAVASRHSLIFGLGSFLLLLFVNRTGAVVASGLLSAGEVFSLATYCLIAGSSLQGLAASYSESVFRSVAAKAPLLEPSSFCLGREFGKRSLEICLRDVWFSSPPAKDKWILRGVSLRLPAGARLALVGSSGSGKSTIAALLLRLIQPTRGQVLLNGVASEQLDEVFVRSLFSVVTQDAPLFEASLRGNVLFAQKAQETLLGLSSGEEEERRWFEAASDAAQISELASRLATSSSDVRGTLSGGQRQRLCIARSLARVEAEEWTDAKLRRIRHAEETTPSPPALCLLLDEATSGLDVATERRVLQGINQSLKGRTAVFVTHRLAFLDIVDFVAVLEEGKLEQFGEKEKVLTHPGPTLQRMLANADSALDSSALCPSL